MDLRDLTPLLTSNGPFVTVLVGAESAVEQAADRYEMAWKAMLQQLEQQGVAEPVREAIFGARGEHVDGEARLVVASVADEQVLLSEPVSSRPASDTLSLDTLPDLLPLVSDVTATVPHVVVHADHTGATVEAYVDAGQLAEEVTVKGRTLHLRKVKGGGWAHHRYQHTAENQWRENAKEIRATAMDLAELIGAELIIGVGDERELTFVKEGLVQPWDTRWVEIPGGRSRDGSEQLVTSRIREAVALHQARESLELLGAYAQERGQEKRACDGVEAVVEALRKAQVETLLLTTGVDQSQQLWFGLEPTALGVTRDEVVALSAETPKQGPLVSVLLRAALATGADVQLVPHQPEQAPHGGVGALLRYSDDS